MKLLRWLLLLLFLPFYPLFFILNRLQAKPCPHCGERYWTELVGEWDGEQWRCSVCQFGWEVPYKENK